MAGDVIYVHSIFWKIFIRDYMVLFEKCSFSITMCIQRGVKGKGMCGSCSQLFPPSAWLLLKWNALGVEIMAMKGKGKHQGLRANPSVSPSPFTHPALKCLFYLLRALQVTRMAGQNFTKRGKSANGIKGKVHGLLCLFLHAKVKCFENRPKLVKANMQRFQDDGSLSL